MSGYMWAKTADGALFVVLVVDGKGYVPGVENAIALAEFDFMGPVQWPLQSQNSRLSSYGRDAAGATHECRILPFVANG